MLQGPLQHPSLGLDGRAGQHNCADPIVPTLCVLCVEREGEGGRGVEGYFAHATEPCTPLLTLDTATFNYSNCSPQLVGLISLSQVTLLVTVLSTLLREMCVEERARRVRGRESEKERKRAREREREKENESEAERERGVIVLVSSSARECKSRVEADCIVAGTSPTPKSRARWTGWPT